ncbi:MAG: glycosyltransferase family 39 protein [Candidatus Micrarchaeota archaeon]
MAFPVKEFLRKHEAVILAIVFVAAYAATSDQYSNSYDQLRNLMVARGILQTGVPAFEDVAYWQHPPLFNYLVAGTSLLTGGDLYIAGQAVVLAFAALAVVFFYKLAAEVSGEKTAFWATVMLGAMPLVWEHADRVMHESAVLFFFAAIPYCWLKFNKTGRMRYAAAAGVLLGLGLLTKSTMLLAIPVIGLIQLVYAGGRIASARGFKDFAKPLAIAGIIALAVFSPYLLYRQANAAPPLESYLFPIFKGEYDWDPRMPVEWYVTDVQASLTIPIAVLLVAGAYSALGRKEDKNGLWLWLWCLAVLGFMSVAAHKEARFMMPLVPAAVLLAAMGVEWLAEKLRHRDMLFAVAAAYLAATSLFIVLQDGSWPGAWPLWKEVRALDTHSILVGEIPPGYMAAAFFGGKTALSATQTEEDNGAMFWFNTRYAVYPDSHPPENMTKIKAFPECGCSLYRIREEAFFGAKQFRVVDEEGRPVPGALVDFAFSESLGLTNSSGDAVTDAGQARGVLSVRRMCYTPFEADVRMGELEEITLKRMPNCLIHGFDVSRI